MTEGDASSYSQMDPLYHTHNGMRMCPYNKSHSVSSIRMPQHLIKCARFYARKDMFECPWNATHHVHETTIKEHVKTCDSRKELGPGYPHALKNVSQEHMWAEEKEYTSDIWEEYKNCAECDRSRRNEDYHGETINRIKISDLTPIINLHLQNKGHMFEDMVILFSKRPRLDSSWFDTDVNSSTCAWWKLQKQFTVSEELYAPSVGVTDFSTVSSHASAFSKAIGSQLVTSNSEYQNPGSGSTHVVCTELKGSAVVADSEGVWENCFDSVEQEENEHKNSMISSNTIYTNNCAQNNRWHDEWDDYFEGEECNCENSVTNKCTITQAVSKTSGENANECYHNNKPCEMKDYSEGIVVAFPKIAKEAALALNKAPMTKIVPKVEHMPWPTTDPEWDTHSQTGVRIDFDERVVAVPAGHSYKLKDTNYECGFSAPMGKGTAVQVLYKQPIARGRLASVDEPPIARGGLESVVKPPVSRGNRAAIPLRILNNPPLGRAAVVKALLASRNQ